ncbi:MAG TPA: DUF2243 domain-containing protein [Gaiellaceae bacterium]|nr:DUF2243 domain-containing protein [Gaiellaceae bacterium]
MATVTRERGSALGATDERDLRVPGLLLGIGLGGFVDGIVLHQIAQWHNMLSSTERWPRTTLEGMEANMLADGLFHTATWVFVALGVYALWSATRAGGHGPASGRALLGWSLVGWGLFNVVEGVVDHQILGIHHVRDESLAWDLGFLAFGVVLVIGGWLLARADERRAEPA